MFRWFRPKFTAPTLLAGNPGQGCTFQAELPATQGSSSEQIDLLDLLAATLQDEKQLAKRHDRWLELPSGVLLHPQIVSSGPNASKPEVMQTCTTIQANHPGVFPAGVFEYQHSHGTSVREAVVKGFAAWAQCDLPVLQDALGEKPRACTTMEMTFLGDMGMADEQPRTRVRRILFGPPARAALRPVAAQEDASGHDFCPCCLLTRNMDTFQALVEREEFCAIRMFAARDMHGQATADCRVNGKEWQPGAKALSAYVQTWPDLGFEWRKQYVVLQSRKEPAAS